jgi:hypothetical protein
MLDETADTQNSRARRRIRVAAKTGSFAQLANRSMRGGAHRSIVALAIRAGSITPLDAMAMIEAAIRHCNLIEPGSFSGSACCDVKARHAMAKA